MIVEVRVPTDLDGTETELLTRLAEHREERIGTSGGSSLFSRIKSAFS